MRRDDDREALDEMERHHRLGELVRRTRRAIAMNQLAGAEQIAAEAAELAPDTTTVEELLGDVEMARGRFDAARKHFERALEIEPINADAEAKLGEAVIRIRDAADVRERMERVVEDPDEYQGFRKNPVTAAFYSVVPGLGQLYNGEYYKGLALTASALVLLAWVLERLLSYQGAALIAGARNPRLDPEAARQVIEGYGPLTWTLIILAIVAYLAIWVYSIFDAYVTCARMAREADEMGVEV
ncbi:MAG: tetratricopeptide repeat protein [Armatimonadota bacterium]|jgi:tetratricopeptide (TPR) repeat protein